ncbi:adhesion G protein-coupled receptor G3 isoform X2 [Salmo salar]|uniref:Adhesion G protein-coupled receptor G3 isoform X2 n=1 Tax=Salmo salar TaxID=8030 RepID=A0A1S3PSM4_SALSA|nr:adhesion G protein-coupled receptor G3-like isoform X2 [Salmo salar]|eukprot:XP_014030687.1 PREDICTED: probable G-protein coupled receptor 97 isoform X2 [Salmo salar]
MKVPSSSNMFKISQFGYGVFVLVVYFFVLVVYKASSSQPGCMDVCDPQRKPATHKRLCVDKKGHECFSTYQMSSLTRMCTLIMEISHIQQCIDLFSRQVSFSFTWNTTCKHPDLSSGLPDCAINILQPYVNDGKEILLIECVAQWTFISMTNHTTASKNKDITNTRCIAGECDCENIKHTSVNNNLISVDVSIRKCKGKAKTKMTGQQLHSIINTFHNITKQGPQKVILDSIKGSVTSQKKNNLLNFRMALPSTNNATLEEMDDIWLEIPTEALNAILGHTKEEVNLGAFWFEDDSLFPVEENNTELLNSRVVSVDVGEDISDLRSYMKITFLFQNASLENKSLACVFWDLENDTVAHWNSSGCVTETKENKTVCSCNHLSFFAVLMSPGSGSNASLSSSSVWLLTLLSRVGCGISLCFLCLALLIHLRGKSDDSLCIHIHLCVALLCLNLTFLVNDSLASLGVHGLCVATAAATHYSLLCTLTWFSMEGFHLYLLIIRVFNIHVNRYLLKLSLVGWGIPGIVVTIIVACGKYGEYRLYLQDGGAVKMCWLTDSAVTTVSFSYFVLTFVVNTLCFGSVTVKVVRAHRQSPVLRERGMNRGTVLSLLGLAWLLGVSWGVMLFQFGPLRETAFYIFCTINSLHGLFLFLRYWALTRAEKASISKATTVSS